MGPRFFQQAPESARIPQSAIIMASAGKKSEKLKNMAMLQRFRGLVRRILRSLWRANATQRSIRLEPDKHPRGQMSLTYATQVHERLEKSIELPNIETIGWIDTLPNRFRQIGGTGPAIGVEA